MAHAQLAPADLSARQRTGRRALALIALIALAPIVASYIAYYGPRPAARTNYGELVDPPGAPQISGTAFDGTAFALSQLRGKWVLLSVDAGCDARCARKLYATRQSRLMQGRERDRVVRLWLVSRDADVSSAALADQPGLVAVRADESAIRALEASGVPRDGVAIVDPLGNLILRYPPDTDIKRLARDLSHLLAASSIG